MFSLNNILTNDTIAIYIGSTNIKILVGNKKKVSLCQEIKTPEDSFIDEKIVKLDSIYEAINNFLIEYKIKTKYVSFAIHGQDIVVRHIEIPIMEEKNIRSTVEWEVIQYLPDEGKNHYIDFEVVDKIIDNEKKIYRILTAAVLKEKVDMYLKLAEMLGLKLKSIDISANCIARSFKRVVKFDKTVESIGVIDIGNKNSSIIILDKGKLFMEREVPFGVYNVIRELTRKLELDEGKAQDYLFNKFNFNKINEDNEIEKRIQTLFDNVFSSFSKVIQFYTMGKVSKSLDRIYIIGLGSGINGLGGYVANYFESIIDIPDSVEKLNLRIKLPDDCQLELYINICGLLLRKE